MTAEVQLLSPSTLGFWTRCIRTASQLSQEALAEASGLPTRTIQRIEAGRPTSIATRRSLARGLGYENRDVFEDPAFIAELHKLLETVSEHNPKQHYPNYVKISASVAQNGDDLGNLLNLSQAYLFNCEDVLSAEVKEVAAALFDLLQDYADVWSELTHADRLSASRSFDESIIEIEQLGARLYIGTRDTNFVGSMWTDKTPIAITIGYVVVVPRNRKIEHMLVPKRV
jgi:transcriptional regulator with XRE-family HTH domain